ncbi:MAG: NAD-dependent epimerase/dehydratase family protein [Clostridia bacterium]|nr:NAD-dependent epimerase/dehydratase family protein [Clostridia bacterium]
MKILVTGAKGFVGRNLCAELNNIASGKRRNSPLPAPPEVIGFDVDSDGSKLAEYCMEADFVVNLAGVNRPLNEEEFMTGNLGFTSELIALLEKRGAPCPVLLSSSTQAELDNPYGRSKLAAENAVLRYARRTGSQAYVYRFPNLFGKWCRPNYNSVVATFCNNIAKGLPIVVNDENRLLRLAYIDDVVEEIIRCIAGKKTPDNGYCTVDTIYECTLGRLAGLIRGFDECRKSLDIPEVSDDFVRKLNSTYLSYVSASEAGVFPQMRTDERGSFTELMHLGGMGQVSVNVCRPGHEKGNHWHHTKTEKFIVVSGEGVILQRRIGDAETARIPVTGEKMQIVDMLPGYTHSIVNTGDRDLVFIIWANEAFDPERPDTFFEKVNLEEKE